MLPVKKKASGRAKPPDAMLFSPDEELMQG